MQYIPDATHIGYIAYRFSVDHQPLPQNGFILLYYCTNSILLYQSHQPYRVHFDFQKRYKSTL